MSLKEILKRSPLRDLAVSALHLGGMTKPHKAHRGRMCAVSLHRVLPAELLASYPIPGIAMTTDEFRWFLEYFGEYFRPTTVRDGYRALLGDEAKDDPRPLLAVTFDDGQLDNFLYAAPLLSEFNIKATFCVPTDGIECQETLWHDRLGFSVRSLLAEGTWDASGFSARLGLAREQAHSPAEWVQAAKGLSQGLAHRAPPLETPGDVHQPIAGAEKDPPPPAADQSPAHAPTQTSSRCKSPPTRCRTAP